MDMPKESAVLLSLVNMKLRDAYDSLDALCDDLEWERDALEARLCAAGYCYDEAKNTFH